MMQFLQLLVALACFISFCSCAPAPREPVLFNGNPVTSLCRLSMVESGQGFVPSTTNHAVKTPLPNVFATHGVSSLPFANNNIRDGKFGTQFRSSVDGFVGFSLINNPLETGKSIKSFAFGTNNLGVNATTGSLGNYTFYVTNDIFAELTVRTTWTPFAFLQYTSTSPQVPQGRHLYQIDNCGNTTLSTLLSAATGFLVHVSGGTVVDELEIYDTFASNVVDLGQCKAFVEEAAGSFDANSTNFAAASQHAVAFTSNLPTTGNQNVSVINDGKYGANVDGQFQQQRLTGAPAIVGVKLAKQIKVSHVAFSHRNLPDGPGAFPLIITPEAYLGTYYIEVTTSTSAALNDSSTVGKAPWTRIAKIQNFGNTTAPNPSKRHLYSLSCPTDAIAVRIVLPFAGLTVIDEVEIYEAPTKVSMTVPDIIFSNKSQIVNVALENTTVLTSFDIGLNDGGNVSFVPANQRIQVKDGKGSFHVTCLVEGPLEIFLRYAGSTKQVAIATTFCHGATTLVNPPTSIVRGNQFSFDVRLAPAPREVTEFVVTIDKPLIFVSTPRITFGIGQTTATAKFSALLGDIGNVTISFRSRRLRSYQSVEHTIAVLGTFTTSLDTTGSLFDGTSTAATITLNPTPKGLVTAAFTPNAASVRLVPNKHTYKALEASTQVSILPLSNVATFTLSAPFYQSRTMNFSIAGKIYASSPSSISIGQTVSFPVHISPKPFNQTVTVSVIVTENPKEGNTSIPTVSLSTNTLTFKDTSSQLLTIVGLREGSVTIDFNTTTFGFTAERDVVQIVPELQCNTLSIKNAAGDRCLQCPTFNKNTSDSQNPKGICNGFGTCKQSTYDVNRARCVCNSNWAGFDCSIFTDSSKSFPFDAPGGTFTFNNVVFTIPPNTINPPSANALDGRKGTAIARSVDGKKGDAIVNVAESTLPTAGNGFTVKIGGEAFVLDIVTADNTRVSVDQNRKRSIRSIEAINSPVKVAIKFDASKVSQQDFLNTFIYYYDTVSRTWKRADLSCPTASRSFSRNAISFTITLNICESGQMQAFVVTPPPAHNVPTEPNTVPVAPGFGNEQGETLSTTGKTGIQAPLPENPRFQPVADPNKGSPRIKIRFSSSANNLQFNAFSLLLACLSIFLFNMFV